MHIERMVVGQDAVEFGEEDDRGPDAFREPATESAEWRVPPPALITMRAAPRMKVAASRNASGSLGATGETARRSGKASRLRFLMILGWTLIGRHR